LLGLGDSLLQLGEPALASEKYALLPVSLRDTPDVALRIAVSHLATGRTTVAAAMLKRQVLRNSRNWQAAALLARCYAVMSQFERARLLAEGVLREQPDHPEALKAACMALSALGDIGGALTCSRRLLDLQPSQTNAAHYLYYLLFSAVAAVHIEAEYLRVQKQFAGVAVPTGPRAIRRSAGKVRVGYVSALFGGHLGCFLPIFQHYDRERFEIHAFADIGQAYAGGRAKLKPLCDKWHEIEGLRNEEVADLVRQTRIDVLVDCDGMFENGRRLGVYTKRPAPIQVAYLYPHRTGMSAIDYQIVDRLLFPEDVCRTSEKLVLLPLFACHQPPSNPMPVSGLPALRNGFVTFGSFNPPLKINEAVVAVWARILNRVPRSRLILQSKMGPLSGDPYLEIRRRYHQLFAKHGVSARRITLIGDREFEVHLAMYHKVDIALDPWPHNGMRTTFMALWMGVPVLTKAGEAMVSRMGVSLLSEAGLLEWVAPDVDGYVELACAHCDRIDRLAQLRHSLRDRVSRSRLMDGERYTRSLEGAFDQMLAESQPHGGNQ
jgi:predicted O-linked N-acetylglucosamine transferase (SPINDLY family)